MVEIKKMYAPILANGARCGQLRTGMRGVTIHQTGNPSKGAGALNHASYLQNSGKNNQASWHYCVDDHLITQSIPENEIAWHSGDGYGDGNYKTIAIEICINADGNMTKACDNAAELAADILKRYGLGIDYLFQHHDWSGKNCPAQIRSGIPYDWQAFKNKVAAHLGQKPQPVPSAKVRKINQHHVFKIGDIVIFPAVYRVDEVSANGRRGFANGAIASYELCYGKPVFEHNWIDAGPCDEVTAEGTKTGDQIFVPGERFRIQGDFKVLDVYRETVSMPNGAIKIHIGQKDVILDAGPAYFVYFE